MSKTRTESYSDAVYALNNNHNLSKDGAKLIFLVEIAGSLAVIADYMTTKKEGDVDEYTN